MGGGGGPGEGTEKAGRGWGAGPGEVDMRGRARGAAQAAGRRGRGRGRAGAPLGARGACAVGPARARARATRRCSGQPCVLNVPVSSFRAPGVAGVVVVAAAEGVPPGAWQGGRCWAQCISFRSADPGPRALAGTPRGPFVAGVAAAPQRFPARWGGVGWGRGGTRRSGSGSRPGSIVVAHHSQ